MIAWYLPGRTVAPPAPDRTSDELEAYEVEAGMLVAAGEEGPPWTEPAAQ